jgi:uncharacterized protein (DUF1330 family)
MPAAPHASLSGSGFAPKGEPRGYFLALSQVSEVQRFQQYRSVVAKLRQIYAGRELVRTQPLVTVVGPPTEGVITIVEHATISQLRMLLAAPEYLALHEKLGTLAPGPTWAVPGVWPLPEPLFMPPPGVDPVLPRAYAIAQYRIDDPERLNRFRGLIARLVLAWGGRFLVRLEPLDPSGITPTDRFLTLIEFPSLKAVYSAVNSPDYQEMLAMGVGHGDPQLWIVEGVGRSR